MCPNKDKALVGAFLGYIEIREGLLTRAQRPKLSNRKAELCVIIGLDNGAVAVASPIMNKQLELNCPPVKSEVKCQTAEVYKHRVPAI